MPSSSGTSFRTKTRVRAATKLMQPRAARSTFITIVQLSLHALGYVLAVRIVVPSCGSVRRVQHPPWRDLANLSHFSGIPQSSYVHPCIPFWGTARCPNLVQNSRSFPRPPIQILGKARRENEVVIWSNFVRVVLRPAFQSFDWGRGTIPKVGPNYDTR